MSEKKLKEEIIARSEAKDWDTAKFEWSLYEVYEAEDPETCLCGHYPIIELCILQNRLNQFLATVGNCCVKKFLKIGSDKIFQAIKCIRKDIKKALNSETVEYGFNKGWINTWERRFYLDTMRNQILSHKQKKKRIQINEKFLAKIRRSNG